MVMEVHFICSGPVLRRGVGRKGECVSIWRGVGVGADVAGGEAGRSILYVPDLINFNPSSSRNGVIEMHI